MKVLVAPVYDLFQRGEFSLFLGGGITDCPDWQAEIIELIQSRIPEKISSRVVLFNPRRADFDVTNPNESERQIDWEYSHLVCADVVLFWFPKETLCPITLFELGKMLGSGRRIVVGCHPEYKRKFDVEYQISLEHPEFKVASSLEELADLAIKELL